MFPSGFDEDAGQPTIKQGPHAPENTLYRTGYPAGDGRSSHSEAQLSPYPRQIDVYKRQLKILVNRFMISAYSFKRVTIVIIKTTSRRDRKSVV